MRALMRSLKLGMKKQFQSKLQRTLLSQQPHRQRKKTQKVDQKLLKVHFLPREKLLKALLQLKERLLEALLQWKEKLLKALLQLKEKLLKALLQSMEKLQTEHHPCKFLQPNLPGCCSKEREDQEDQCFKFLVIFGYTN